MAPSVILLLLVLLNSANSLPPPRISFLHDSADRPLVFFSIQNATTLLLSDDGSTLYVGAQNALLSLDVNQSDVIKLKKKVEWRPSDTEINECEAKGKNPKADCPNFVHVLQPMNSSHLYACGSYAHSPREAYIDKESFSIIQQGGAKGRCAFSPFQSSTALVVNGELFTATTTDFRGDEPQISRHFSKDGRPDVSLDGSVSLLDEPKFVSSSLDLSHKKLYFFFSEVGKEFSFVDELRIARVAQVCKDDIGGQMTLQKKWTSFAKAPLLCQAPKQLPFSVLLDMFTLQSPEGSNASDTLFYGVFSSQWSAAPQSAVCVFSQHDVRMAFTESYRTLDTQTHQWSPMLGKHSYLGKCGLDNASNSDLAKVKRSFLTSSSVKPVGGGPLLVSSGQKYSHVAAMRTQASNGKHYTVLFLLTESGFLHKVGLFDQGPQVIEEIQVSAQPQLTKSIVLSTSKGVVYLGTSEGVVALPVARCSIYTSCSQCVLSRDPLCGWSRSRRVCARLDGRHDNMAQDLEDVNVEEKCNGQTEACQLEEVSVHLNEAVRLQCLKPSNLASLSWTSSRFKELPQERFIQSAEGTLTFIASANTFGMYHCNAEEGKYKEVVRSYDVRQAAAPRSLNPIPTGDEHHEPGNKDKSDHSIITETARTPVIPEDAEDATMNKFTISLEHETESRNEDSGSKNSFEGNSLDVTPTSRTKANFNKELRDDPKKMTEEKSYYNELVVVSLLLAACICVLMLGGLHMWRQRRTGLKPSPLVSPDCGSKTHVSMESVPSLSSPEDPEVKVEQ